MIPLPTSFYLKFGGTLLAALLLALLVHDRNHWKDTATLRQTQLNGEIAAHQATVANYRAAAERARREDAENLARAKAEQSAINERTSDEFEARIADARARADRLRSKVPQAGTDPGGRGATPVSGVPAAAGGAVEAAGQGGLPPSDALIATEQAIQLDELIKWVRRQAAVPVNGGPGERQSAVPVNGSPPR